MTAPKHALLLVGSPKGLRRGSSARLGRLVLDHLDKRHTAALISVSSENIQNAFGSGAESMPLAAQDLPSGEMVRLVPELADTHFMSGLSLAFQAATKPDPWDTGSI